MIGRIGIPSKRADIPPTPRVFASGLEPDARIHLTSADGVFSEDPSWVIPLDRAPDDKELVDVEDIDGDGRDDVAFFNLNGVGFVGTILRSGP